MPELTWLEVPGSPNAWHALGFDVPGDVVHIGRITLEVDADGFGWGFEWTNKKATDTLGVRTKQVEPQALPSFHPNGVAQVDHVVYAVPSVDEAIDAMADALGLEPKRRGRPREDGPEMAFFRAGEAVIEVVEAADQPKIWGVALRSEDLDRTVEAAREAGGPIGDPKPAIQGGRIAAVPTKHLGMPLAILDR